MQFDIRHAEAAREALRATDIAGKKAEVQYSAIKRPDKDSNMVRLYIHLVIGAPITGPLSTITGPLSTTPSGQHTGKGGPPKAPP